MSMVNPNGRDEYCWKSGPERTEQVLLEWLSRMFMALSGGLIITVSLQRFVIS